MGTNRRFGPQSYKTRGKVKKPPRPQRGTWTPADLDEAMFVKDMTRGEHIEVWPYENEWLAGYVIVACRDVMTTFDDARPRYLAHVWGDDLHQIPRYSHEPDRQLAYLQANELIQELPETQLRMQAYRMGNGNARPFAAHAASPAPDTNAMHRERWHAATIMDGYLSIEVPDSFRPLMDAGTAAFFAGPKGRDGTYQSLQIYREGADEFHDFVPESIFAFIYLDETGLGVKSEAIWATVGGENGLLSTFRYDAAHLGVPVYGMMWCGYLRDGGVMVIYFCSADQLLMHPTIPVTIFSSINFLWSSSTTAPDERER